MGVYLLLEQTLDLIIFIYTTLTCIFCVYTGLRTILLRIWIPSMIFLPFGALFVYLQYFNEDFRLIGNISYLLSLILLAIPIYFEYNSKVRKMQTFSSNKGEIIERTLVSASLILIIFSIEVAMLIFLGIAGYFLYIIYSKSKTPTRFFMILTFIGAFISVLSTILNNFALNGMWELSYVTNFILVTFLLATAFVANLERRLVDSEAKYRRAYNQAAFYKDLFVHDINNILQNINTSVDIITMDTEVQKRLEFKEVLFILREQVFRGDNLVKSIRNLSRIEELGIFIQRIEVCILLKKALEYIKKSYPHKKINIQFNCPKKEYFVKANELLLDIFENLLLNAIQHNKNSPIEIQIHISNEFQDGINWIKFQFIDNGIGIQKARRETIFQRVYSQPKMTKGMGLGLTLVKIIVDSYAGNILVEDRVPGDYSKGSNFVMLLREG